MESFRSKLCPQPSTLAAIFVLALAIRWTYDIVTYLTMGLPGLLGADSYAYVQVAQTFAGQIEAHAVSNWQWLGPNPSFMPLFTWLLTLCALVFGTAAPLAYTLIQGLCDAATCCVVYNIAQTIDRRIAIYAAVAAAINPTQVVVAGLVYPDTPFVFFVSLFLCGSLRWIQLPTWRSTLLIGVGLVGAAQIRILVAPWGPALLLFLIAVPVIRRQLRAPYVAQLGLAGLILAVGLAGISLRNLTQYGSASLTPQGGTHLNWWVVPLVQEAKDGTPWAVTMQAMQDRTRARFGADSRNPFIQSERNTQVATDELKMLGAAAIIKAWLYGAVLNLGSPAILLAPVVSLLPRTGFYGTHGRTMFEKIANFLFHSDNARYAWIVIGGILGLVIVRMLQAAGLFEVLRLSRNYAGILLLAGWCLYILVINGPVASPKYRLPMEPTLVVLWGAGYVMLRDRVRGPHRRPERND